MPDWIGSAGSSLPQYLALHRNEALMTAAIVLLVELVVRVGGYVTRRKHIRTLEADEGGR